MECIINIINLLPKERVIQIMKKAGKFVCFVLSVLIFSAGTAASAATITFSNALDLRVSITVAYYDADSGVLTTRGWWHAEPGGETIVTVNADESRDIYYAAYNKVPFLDSSTRNNPQIRRWASPRAFTYTTDSEPDEDDVWGGHFYKINGNSVRVNERTRP